MDVSAEAEMVTFVAWARGRLLVMKLFDTDFVQQWRDFSFGNRVHCDLVVVCKMYVGRVSLSHDEMDEFVLDRA